MLRDSTSIDASRCYSEAGHVRSILEKVRSGSMATSKAQPAPRFKTANPAPFFKYVLFDGAFKTNSAILALEAHFISGFYAQFPANLDRNRYLALARDFGSLESRCGLRLGSSHRTTPYLLQYTPYMAGFAIAP